MMHLMAALYGCVYYNRKTADVKPNPTEPGGDTDGGKIIYGGDFTGQLPPAPSKAGL